MGLKPYDQPGPPETLEVPVGLDRLRRWVQLSPDAPKLVWQNGTEGTDGTDMTKADGSWTITHLVNESSSYQLLVTMPGLEKARVLAAGQGDGGAGPFRLRLIL